jgi:hypothetical protein
MWCDKELEEKSKFPGIGPFLKHHGMKECVTFVTLRRLKMKNTFS